MHSLHERLRTGVPFLKETDQVNLGERSHLALTLFIKLPSCHVNVDKEGETG